MIVFPNAKINIGLNIVRDRADGYHDLETIFYPIPVSESLECVVSPENEDVDFLCLGLSVAGDAQSNLVVKAVNLLKKEGYKIPGLKVILDKRIPMGAGIGGGSADATFMLMMLNEKFNLEISKEELIRMAAKLGADCPFFVLNSPVYATGIGEVMTPIDLNLGGLHFVLVRPNVFVSTKQAFSGIVSKPSIHSLPEVVKYPISEWHKYIHNDFEDSIFPSFPEIKRVKDILVENGALYASMSGSGSSVYGIFDKCPDSHLSEKFADSYYFHTILPNV